MRATIRHKLENTITLTIKETALKIIQATSLVQWLEDFKDKRYIFCYGGAGSGKTTSIIIYLIKCMLEGRDMSILICRRTMPSIKMTVWRVMLEYLEKMCPGQYQVNKTDYIITIGSNDCQFKSMDDEFKIRSLSVNKVFIEECSEITLAMYLQLELRIRKGKNQQMIMATNPISIFSWPYQEIYLNNDQNIAKHHSTYKDNLLLSQDYIDNVLLKLKGNNRTVYLLGDWGKAEGLIFTSYEVVDKIFDTISTTVAGLDFGFTSETACSLVHIRQDKKFFAEELLYEKGLTNQELIRRLEKLIPDKETIIYADSAEPNRIREIWEAGFNIRQSNKDVSAGIDHMIEFMIGVKSSSVNLLKELQTYSWQLDSSDRVIPKPNKGFDHLIDSIRMASFTNSLYGNRESRNLDWLSMRPGIR